MIRSSSSVVKLNAAQVALAWFLFSLTCFVLTFPNITNAQSITLTSPSASVNVIEGDDFATSVLGNAWDFNERRDIGWEENFVGSSVQTSGGVWTGVNEAAGGYVFPLFGGFMGGLYAGGVEGDKTLPAFGFDSRIDASKYRLLSYRLNHSSRSSYAVYWKSDDSVDLWPDGSQNCIGVDGKYTPAFFANSGYNIYSFDMGTLSDCELSEGAWTGNIFALRIDPSAFGAVGATTEIDWIRLVDPDSAPVLSVQWTSSDLSFGRVMTVYVDTNSSGYDGTPVARFGAAQDSGTYSFKTAMLPPGEYYFYVTSSVGAELTEQARSNYSAKLSISKAPSVIFTAPTTVSGVDYATAEVGNSWDMSDATDVSNLEGSQPYELRQFSSPVFSNGIFSAIADIPLEGNNESDVQVRLNIPTSSVVNARSYCYLTYRMMVDGSNFSTIADKVRRGWVSRPIYWGFNLFVDGGRPKAHVVYEDWHTYTINLCDSSIVEAGQSWSAVSRVQHLRIDPLETSVPTAFSFDSVQLTTLNQPQNNNYTISWTVEDSDSSTFSVSLYYDSNDSGFDGTKIVDLTNRPSGSDSYNWNTTSLADGSYYIYVVVSDGGNTRKCYAPVPVVLDDLQVAPRVGTPPYDYDGDGRSDTIIFRPGDSTYYLNSSIVGITLFPWGSSAHKPLQGDFDGDQSDDYATVAVVAGDILDWAIRLSADGALYRRFWGVRGDRAVIADYNGDGRDDIAVYRSGFWYVLYEDGTAAVHAWGMPDDIPVPADYDGDGKADIAIWRPSDGNWWILNSGFASGATSDFATVIQWGLPGDIPMPADWTGDGKSDVAVWRNWNGTWYIQDIADSTQVEIIQWGLPGDVPIVTDTNGDGVLDPTVVREWGGMWFSNFRDGNVSAAQWGLSGDAIPRAWFVVQ